jgi:hypothetical protein
MAKNVPTSFIARPSKFFPNEDYWLENMPSGNPGHDGRLKEVLKLSEVDRP